MLEQFKESKGISHLTDPFTSDKVTSLVIRYKTPWLKKEFKWYATIFFQNRNTSGEHTTQKHEKLEDCLKEIEATIKSL